MTLRLALTLALTVPALAACDRVSLPSWPSAPPATTLEPDDGYLPPAVDERPLVARITSVAIEPTPGGIIVLARAQPPFQEYWRPDLVPAPGSDPTGPERVFEFRAFPPVDSALRGSEASRELQAAVFLSESELRGVRRITVVGAANSISRNR